MLKHIPVLKKELVDSLNIKDGDIVVDCTAGFGGHIDEIQSRYSGVKVIAIDKDNDSTSFLMNKFSSNPLVKVINADYRDIDDILSFFDIEKVNAVYADLGFSSHQIDTIERGFSFLEDSPLDMRFNQKQELTAYNIINDYSYEYLKDIFKKYGDERFAALIANKISYLRDQKKIETTAELRKIVHSVYYKKTKGRSKIDPATKVFQAVRIAVNSEFEAIETLISKVEKVLLSKGRFSIISFHSGEDRIIKKTLNQKVNPCTCPPDFPKCVCGNKKVFKHITKKPIVPQIEELKNNPRSRSAKLRVVELL